MKPLFTYVVAGVCLASGCSRIVETGTVTAIDELDAAADVADVVLPGDASAADLADAPSPSGNDLCGPENALLPNEGEPCAVALGQRPVRAGECPAAERGRALRGRRQRGVR